MDILLLGKNKQLNDMHLLLIYSNLVLEINAAITPFFSGSLKGILLLIACRL
jgi:hypothetical protein